MKYHDVIRVACIAKQHLCEYCYALIFRNVDLTISSLGLGTHILPFAVTDHTRRSDIKHLYYASPLVFMLVFLTLSVIACTLCSWCVQAGVTHGDHLVVLSHGIHGSKTDLTYLSQHLEKAGCVVLRSASNEFLRSQNGIEKGAKNLALEILSILASNTHLTRISFVGNSLGGLYTRYVAKELYDQSSGLIAGLRPHYFLVC